MKTSRLLVIVLAFALSGFGSLQAQSTYEPYRFTTFAGAAGIVGSANGPVETARFNSPAGVAVDKNGAIYIADTGNHTIRKIAGGVAGILAGSPGMMGSANGVGTAARFFDPTGVAVDSALNVYVADSGNNTIRKISPSRVVTTLAGAPGLVGSANGTGSAARFNGPRGVAVDSAGNVYVADTFNHTIRKITPAGVVTTLAGLALSPGSANGVAGAARFNSPKGVAVDSSFNVYVADTFNNMIRKITPGGTVTTLAGLAGAIGSTDGIGTSARFNGPIGLAVDDTGSLFVADTDNQLLRKVTAGGVVTTLGGLPLIPGSADGIGNAARFNSPQGLAVYGVGFLYVGDTGNNTVRRGLSISAPKTDFNGDGFPDYLLLNPSTRVTAIWYLQESALLGGLYGPTLPPGWTVACVADLNLDNQPDYILFHSATRRTAVWFLNNNALAGGVYGPTLPPGWALFAATDINGDGMPDYVLFNSSTRQSAIWYLNGALYVSAAFGPRLPVGWTLSDAANFNSDLKPDFVLRNASTRQTAIWYLNGSVYVSGAFGPTLPPGWTLQGAADFDADGKPDYLLYNSSTRRSALWYLNGTAFVGGAYGPTPAAGYNLVSP